MDTNVNAYLLKQAPFERLSRYRSAETYFGEPHEYKLVYKTGDTVQYIPGTKRLLNLKEYKDDLGVGYSRITLYQCDMKKMMMMMETVDCLLPLTQGINMNVFFRFFEF